MCDTIQYGFFIQNVERTSDPTLLIAILGMGSSVADFLYEVEQTGDFIAQNSKKIPNLGIVVSIEFVSPEYCEKVYNIILQFIQQQRKQAQRLARERAEQKGDPEQQQLAQKFAEIISQPPKDQNTILNAAEKSTQLSTVIEPKHDYVIESKEEKQERRKRTLCFILPPKTTTETLDKWFIKFRPTRTRITKFTDRRNELQWMGYIEFETLERAKEVQTAKEFSSYNLRRVSELSKYRKNEKKLETSEIKIFTTPLEAAAYPDDKRKEKDDQMKENADSKAKENTKKTSAQAKLDIVTCEFCKNQIRGIIYPEHWPDCKETANLKSQLSMLLKQHEQVPEKTEPPS